MHFAWDAEVPGWMRRCMAVVERGVDVGGSEIWLSQAADRAKETSHSNFHFWISSNFPQAGSEDHWQWLLLAVGRWIPLMLDSIVGVVVVRNREVGWKIVVSVRSSRVHPRAVLPQCRTCRCSDQWCGGTSPSHRGTPLPMCYICLLSSGNKAPARSILSSQSSCSCWMITLKTCEFWKDFSKPCFPGISSISWCEFSAPMIV